MDIEDFNVKLSTNETGSPNFYNWLFSKRNKRVFIESIIQSARESSHITVCTTKMIQNPFILLKNENSVLNEAESSKKLLVFKIYFTAHKMKFSIKDFFSKCDQVLISQRIWSHLLKKYLMENFIFCAVAIREKMTRSVQFAVLDITFFPWNTKSFRCQVTLGIPRVSQEKKIMLQSFMSMNHQQMIRLPNHQVQGKGLDFRHDNKIEKHLT